MDEFEITIDTFNRRAVEYQTKYMDFEFYFESYDAFCQLLPVGPLDMLEIACGPGNVTRYLLKKRPDLRIVGIDLAPKMIELARVINPEVDYRVMDSRAISTLGGPVDAIMCGFCIPYLSQHDVVRLIKDARQLLSEGGIFHLSTMEGDYSQSGLQTNSMGDQVVTHYYTAEFLQQQLRQSGFEILETTRKKFDFEGSQPATDLFIYAQAQ